jgi:hypothetical protein
MKKFVGIHLDFIGFSASLACAIHCAVLPFLLALAPLAGLEMLENPWIEYGFILTSLGIASSSLTHGYRKHHKKLHAFVMMGLGFVFIAAGQLIASEALEIPLMAAGGLMVAIAHLINWRHIQQSEVAYPDCCQD